MPIIGGNTEASNQPAEYPTCFRGILSLRKADRQSDQKNPDEQCQTIGVCVCLFLDGPMVIHHWTSKQCRRWDSNPHFLWGNWILNPASMNRNTWLLLSLGDRVAKLAPQLAPAVGSMNTEIAKYPSDEWLQRGSTCRPRSRRRFSNSLILTTSDFVEGLLVEPTNQ